MFFRNVGIQVPADALSYPTKKKKRKPERQGCVNLKTSHVFKVVSATKHPGCDNHEPLEGKGRVHLRTGHEGPQGEYMYSSTLSLTLALVGVWAVSTTPRSLQPPGKTRYPLYRSSRTNVIQCSYTNLDSIAYCTPGLYGIAYCC